MILHRRTLLHAAGVGGLASLATAVLPTGAFAQTAALSLAGSDLSGWSTVLGDGIWTGPGQVPVNSGDVRTDHHGDRSTLWANVNRRGVMAHNITYLPQTDSRALDLTHNASFDFRMPYVPKGGGTYNAQTLEAGLFVWDGGGSRRDLGLAFQWILNPWMAEFGHIRVWAQQGDGVVWKSVSYLRPDTETHRAILVLHPAGQLASLHIDGNAIPVAMTRTPKASNWTSDTVARLQNEIISLWPGSNAVAPSHQAEFRNWTWTATEQPTAQPTGSQP